MSFPVSLCNDAPPARNQGTSAFPTGHGPRSRLWVPAALLLAALHTPGEADAYRLWPTSDNLITTQADALRWSRTAWPPGGTLIWEIVPDPCFDLMFGSIEGMVDFVEQALDVWSAIPTADIRWRVRIADSVGPLDPERRNLIRANPEQGVGGGTGGGFDEYQGDLEERRTGRIKLGTRGCLDLQDREPSELQYRRDRALAVLVHEFGHALGILHADPLSLSARLISDGSVGPLSEILSPGSYRSYVGVAGVGKALVHPLDPVMSNASIKYAGEPSAWIRADDAVAASLIRPAPGFLSETGNIQGVLGVGGSTLRFAHVWAAPIGRGRALLDRVGAFSDERGVFRIEGLPPGDYLLWAGPLVSLTGNRELTEQSTALDLKDTLVGYPIQVRAGETSEVGTVSLSRGRSPRPPPGSPIAGQEAHVGQSIIDDWAAPCSGIRLRAVGRPTRLSHGPWWTSRDPSGDGRHWSAVSLDLEWSEESARVVLDWDGPYRNWSAGRDFEPFEDWRESGRATSPKLDVSVSQWIVRHPASDSVRHTVQLAWPEDTEMRLGLRSEDGSCPGEPALVCTLDDCILDGGFPQS